MKIIKPSVQLLLPPMDREAFGQWVLEHIEGAYRRCYKSEDKICPGSAAKIIHNMGIKHGHTSPLEHFSFTALFICDRGVTHEIVRHRLASYSQESTRYCNYSGDKFGNEITVIRPCFLNGRLNAFRIWENACQYAESQYFEMLRDGATPQEARAVLPSSLKTELEMTADIPEWRHFFKLRCDPAAHPQMREVALMGLEQAHDAFPVVFDDLWEQYKP